MQSVGKGHKRNWVSLVPYGLNQQHPNAYKDMLAPLWENRDNLGYAWRILQRRLLRWLRARHHGNARLDHEGHPSLRRAPAVACG